MSNNSKIFSILFSMAMASVTIHPAIAQENANFPTHSRENEQKPKPAAMVTKKREPSSILKTIWQMLKAKRAQEPALSSRSNICEITPGLLGENNIIYSDRPLFLWQGKVPNVQVSLYSSFSLDRDQEILWTKTINGESQNVLYTGQALQPGQIYDWEIVADSQANRRRISFQIMAAGERERITSELTKLESELTISGASKQEIILAKAHYFAQKDLWSDTLQQLSSLESFEEQGIGHSLPGKPSASNQEMMSYICQSAKI